MLLVKIHLSSSRTHVPFRYFRKVTIESGVVSQMHGDYGDPREPQGSERRDAS